MMPIVLLPHPDAVERKRLLSVNELRRQALVRLYQRRDVVDDLIRSLETYSEMKENLANCIDLRSALKCS